MLAVARGESVRLPRARPPALGNPPGDDYGWILGQFALLGRTDIVQALLDSGMPVDTRGWSNFTPLEQAAMHGRAATVQLLIERGANVHDCAFEIFAKPEHSAQSEDGLKHQRRRVPGAPSARG